MRSDAVAAAAATSPHRTPRRRPLPAAARPARPSTSTKLAGAGRATRSPPRRCRRRSGASRSIPSRRPTPTCSRSGGPTTTACARTGWPSRTDADRPDRRFEEDVKFRGLHPMIARRLQMWRLSNFEITRLPSQRRRPRVRLRRPRQPVRRTPRRRGRGARPHARCATSDGRVVALPEVETSLVGCLDAIRHARAERPGAAPARVEPGDALRLAAVDLPLDEIRAIARRLAPLTEGLGLEQVVVSGALRRADGSEPVEAVLRLGYEPGRGLTVRLTAAARRADAAARRLHPQGHPDPPARPRLPVRAGAAARAASGGAFVEYDLDDDGRARAGRPAARPATGPASSSVSSRTPTERYPEGITRVAVLGDPTRAMGSITEAECRRLLAAIDLAASMDVPIEWFALSAGAKIAMDSGSENLDWVARVLRRLVEHTQRGGEVNVVVAGINVGAQPYWNAESTMLMHTRGILVMTPDSAMVLTGKQAIDYSGGVSAEDNFGIGGYGRVMGPNGEAQYWAPSLAAACDVLFDHYDLTYRAPGERWPRPAADDRSRRPGCPHGAPRRRRRRVPTVGDVFSDVTNPDRKKPFDIRTLMNAIDRRRPRAARTVARDGRGRDGRRVRRPPRRPRGVADRHRVAAAAPPRHDAGRRPGAVVGRHPVPAVVEEGRPGHQRGERVPAGRRARQPVGLRRLTGVAASTAARVRRRDRPGDRELRRPVRAVRRVPLPRRRVRRVLGDAQRRHGGPRRRGLVRLGHRWGAGRRGGVHPRRRRAHQGRPARAGARGGARRRAAGRGRRPRQAELAADPRGRAQREARRGRRRVRRRAQRRSGPRPSARCTASSRPPTSARS